MEFRLSHSFRLDPPASRPAGRDPALAAAEAHRAAGRPDAALATLAALLIRAPDSLPALHLQGVLLTETGAAEPALAPLRRAAALAPEDGRVHYHLGNALLALDRLADAAAAYRAAIAADPGLADAHNNLGNVLRKQGREVAALDAYRAALTHRPGFAPALYNMGLALGQLGEHAAAIDCYRAVLARPPGPGEAEKYRLVRESLAASLVECNDHAGAVEACRAWLAMAPGAALAEWNLGLSLLMQGDFAEGWRLYERRWEIEGFRDESERDQPLPVAPTLAALTGQRVLIRREQGRGDLIQFARYAKLLSRHAACVTLTAYPELVALLGRMPGVAVIDEAAAEPAHDVAVSLMSLPLVLGTTLATVPASVPYLTPDPALVAAWRARLGAVPGVRQVGLCWWGSEHSRRSSIPVEELARLLDLPGFRFHALQPEIPAAQRGFVASRPELVTHEGELVDFDATAALIAALDLVVTIDTSVAHLAGALGRPVLILLRYSPDWRWLRERTDSPWYPTARLFRQGPERDWAGPIRDVRAALAAGATGLPTLGG